MIHTFFDGTKVNSKEVNMLKLKNTINRYILKSDIMVSVGSQVVWLKPNIKEIYTSLEKPDYKPSKDDCINVMKSYINKFGFYEVITVKDFINENFYINLDNLLIVQEKEYDGTKLMELRFKGGDGHFELPYNEDFIKAWEEKHSEKTYPQAIDFGIY